MKEITKITGTLVYVCVPNAVKAYVKKGDPNKPDEWKASVVVTDEDFVDEFEAYAASLDTQVSIKKVKVDEFEEIYKCPVPEGADKKVWVITLRKSTELGKTGEKVPPKYAPKVFEQTESGNRLEITNEKLVGNGSKGAISIDRFDRNKGGSSLYLKNILVTELIEYVPRDNDASEPGSEFDEEDSDEDQKVPESKAEEKPKKAAAKPKSDKINPEDVPF